MRQFSLSLRRDDWVDSGVVLAAGQGLAMTAQGKGRWTSEGDKGFGFPEGKYGPDGDDSETYHPEDVVAVGAFDARFSCGPQSEQVPCFALMAVVWPNDGTRPPIPPSFEPERDGTQMQTGLLRPRRGATYTAEEIAAKGLENGATAETGYRIFVICNDDRHNDNSGTWLLQFDVTGCPAINVQLDRRVWTDSGILITEDTEEIHIVVEGGGTYAPTHLTFPEGFYPPEGVEAPDPYDPSQIGLTSPGIYGDTYFPAAPFAKDGQPYAPPYALVGLLLPEGTDPPRPPLREEGDAEGQMTTGILYPARGRVFSPSELVAAGLENGSGPWRLFLFWNDEYPDDNTGFGTVTICRGAAPGVDRPATPTLMATPYLSVNVPGIRLTGN